MRGPAARPVATAAPGRATTAAKAAARTPVSADDQVPVKAPAKALAKAAASAPTQAARSADEAGAFARCLSGALAVALASVPWPAPFDRTPGRRQPRGSLPAFAAVSRAYLGAAWRTAPRGSALAVGFGASSQRERGGRPAWGALAAVRGRRRPQPAGGLRPWTRGPRCPARGCGRALLLRSPGSQGLRRFLARASPRLAPLDRPTLRAVGQRAAPRPLAQPAPAATVGWLPSPGTM
jgi:hypothetical protein